MSKPVERPIYGMAAKEAKRMVKGNAELQPFSNLLQNQKAIDAKR